MRSVLASHLDARPIKTIIIFLLHLLQGQGQNSCRHKIAKLMSLYGDERKLRGTILRKISPMPISRHRGCFQGHNQDAQLSFLNLPALSHPLIPEP